jgi:hypothetical protein
MANKLYCDTCHTVWVETCFAEWKPCPFKDCAGMLRSTLPPSLAPSRTKPKKEPRTYPLLESAGLIGGDERKEQA